MATATPSTDPQARIHALLAAARLGHTQHKWLAPLRDHAFRYYEHLLQRDPHDAVARDAPREAFPYAAIIVETSIKQKDCSQAQRELALLVTADLANFTLTLLRAKLAAA